jgi:hypothetical protein
VPFRTTEDDEAQVRQNWGELLQVTHDLSHASAKLRVSQVRSKTTEGSCSPPHELPCPTAPAGHVATQFPLDKKAPEEHPVHCNNDLEAEDEKLGIWPAAHLAGKAIAILQVRIVIPFT